MSVASSPTSHLTFQESYWTGRFQAMACPCEILIDTHDADFAAAQLEIAVRECERIENKFSRYRKNTIIDRLNNSAGATVEVDKETADLLDYATQCYELSDGLFDITTGLLRKIWRFDGTTAPFNLAQLAPLRSHIGWERVQWKRPFLQLPKGFEIDFGGIGKEYAADKILALLLEKKRVSTLVNLGGDIAAAGERLWSVGIEAPGQSGKILRTVHLRNGGVATSGTTKRVIKIEGKIYSHILNPKTGWPVQNAPASVTVAAKTCTEAGFWSTLAVLQGEKAESFLQQQSLEFWCDRLPTYETIV